VCLQATLRAKALRKAFLRSGSWFSLGFRQETQRCIFLKIIFKFSEDLCKLCPTGPTYRGKRKQSAHGESRYAD
jgi:hypothetical protein